MNVRREKLFPPQQIRKTGWDTAVGVLGRISSSCFRADYNPWRTQSPDFLMWSWFTLFTRIHLLLEVVCDSYKTLKLQLDTWPFKIKILFPVFHCYQIGVSRLLIKENEEEAVYATCKNCLQGSSSRCLSYYSSVSTGTIVWNGTHLWGIWKEVGGECVEVAPCCLIQDCPHLLIYLYLFDTKFHCIV